MESAASRAQMPRHLDTAVRIALGSNILGFLSSPADHPLDTLPFYRSSRSSRESNPFA
jgi:hypothetical protein